MKKWITVLVVCFAVVLAGGVAPPSCWGTPLINFTDTSASTAAEAWLSDSRMASWTQTVPTANTAIGAILWAYLPDSGGGTAWLTNAIGPGTTLANVIASVTFTAPALDPSQVLDLTTAPITPLFSGLSLDPGTYYLVLQGPPDDPSGYSPYYWLGDITGVTVTTAPGFTVESFGIAARASFPPSSSFDLTLSPPNYDFFTVDGTVVPAPPAILLLGSGLLGLAGWRRFRKS